MDEFIRKVVSMLHEMSDGVHNLELEYGGLDYYLTFMLVRDIKFVSHGADLPTEHITLRDEVVFTDVVVYDGDEETHDYHGVIKQIIKQYNT